jgi:hypothetical protein
MKTKRIFSRFFFTLITCSLLFLNSCEKEEEVWETWCAYCEKWGVFTAAPTDAKTICESTLKRLEHAIDQLSWQWICDTPYKKQ